MSEPYRLPAAERYQRDPEFHHLVDVLQAFVLRGQFTPTELREAIVLALTLAERHLPPQILVDRGLLTEEQWEKLKDGLRQRDV